MSAEIINLHDYRLEEAAVHDIDLVTAVDVARRDLQEILDFWGTDRAKILAEECAKMLRLVYATSVVRPATLP